jgi:hypothetical protein
LVNILGKVSIGFDGVKFGFEFCVYTWIEIDFIASGGFPFKKLVMSFSVLDFLLSSLDLFDDSFFLRKFISFFPESFAKLLYLLKSFTADKLCDLGQVVPSELLATCNKVVEIVL